MTGPPIPTDRWIYGRSIEEDGPKFVFFSLAALWAAEALDWKPDVVHAHDSHAGAAVWWLATEGRDNPFFRDVASVFTIHNLPYAAQGAGQALGDYKLRRDAMRSLVLPEGYRDSLMGARHPRRRLAHDGQPDVRARDPDAARAATASTASCARARIGSPAS